MASIKLYEDNFIIVQLNKKNRLSGSCYCYQIERESARSARFGVFRSENQQLFINESEERQGLKIVQKTLAGLGI